VSLLDVLIVVVGVVAVLVAVKKVWPALKHAAVTITRMSLMLDSVSGLPEFIASTDEFKRQTAESIEVLRHQVENDHKTNLRDELTRVLEVVEPLERKVDQLITSDVAQWREISDTRPGSREPFQPKES